MFCCEWNQLEYASIGLDSTASLVNVETQNMLSCINPPVISSVFAQDFQNQHVILNGCRNGSIWIWDIRTPSCIKVMTSSSLCIKKQSSLHSIYSLEKEQNQFICSTSLGQMLKVDLRNHKTIVEYVGNTSDHHKSRFCTVCTKDVGLNYIIYMCIGSFRFKFNCL